MVSPGPERQLSEVDAWLAQPLTVRPPAPSSDEALAARVRLVLETRPGQLPWAPEFGCDLLSVVGKPATAEKLTEVSARVQEALQRWVPGVLVARCEVRLISELGTRPGETNRAVPTAESALVPFSLRASLEAEVELHTVYGSVTLSALLTP